MDAPFLFCYKGVENVRIRSLVTDRIYTQELMVYLNNPIQIAKYLERGAVLYDLLGQDGKLTAVFSKRETQELYAQWQNREL